MDSRYPKILFLLFLLSLPLCNPWVRGDGVGYYAFARALLIQHNLDFAQDWLHANSSFRMERVDDAGGIRPNQFTKTSHLDNHFAIGPALLWSPFLALAHAGVLSWDKLGGEVPADGFSAPYRYAVALGTAVYGFLALWISFLLARKLTAERWAFLATLGIWFASSLPVYMYFNPSWSHALSAFTVALFVWQWMRTRGPSRTLPQWILLGLVGGLMMDAYYISAIILLLPAGESLAGYAALLKARQGSAAARLAGNHLAFLAALIAAFSPTLVTKKIIYGGFLNFGYTEAWRWTSPAFFKVCFSPEHGAFSWTPILLLATAGLFLLRKRDPHLSLLLLLTFVAYVYAMGCYEDWAGIASFGNRFFVSLTPFFVIGLAAFFDFLCAKMAREPLGRPNRDGAIVAWALTAMLALWNFGMIFQWGTHLIPARGPISFRTAAYNQFAVVPGRMAGTVKGYFTHRALLMNQIEQEDVRTLKSTEPAPAGSGDH